MKKKKIWLSILIVVLIIIVYLISSFIYFTKNYYVDHNAGLSIKKPDGWIVEWDYNLRMPLIMSRETEGDKDITITLFAYNKEDTRDWGSLKDSSSDLLSYSEQDNSTLELMKIGSYSAISLDMRLPWQTGFGENYVINHETEYSDYFLFSAEAKTEEIWNENKEEVLNIMNTLRFID